MRLIKKFTNFSSVNEEFIPKVVTKDSRMEALSELSSTLDKNKLEQLNVLLLVGLVKEQIQEKRWKRRNKK